MKMSWHRQPDNGVIIIDGEMSLIPALPIWNQVVILLRKGQNKSWLGELMQIDLKDILHMQWMNCARGKGEQAERFTRANMLAHFN